jgi:RNA polymerase sigma-70 factor (ECF subfamily)
LRFIENCVQGCLCAIHEARHTYDPARPFRPWLFAIVRNSTVEFLRKSGVSAPSATESLDLRPDGAHHGTDPETGEILLQLKPQFRSALLLTKVHGYSISEAARRSAISERAMKSRVSRAITASKALLNAERD